VLLNHTVEELGIMTSIISDGLKQAQQALGGEHGAKVKQLASDTKEVNEQWRITSDYGVKQTNTENWLRIASDEKTGPMLLEDPFAREKV
jgi:catalase